MTVKTRERRRDAQTEGGPTASERHRSWPKVLWYRFVRYLVTCLLAATAGVRASGVRNIPPSGGALLVSNHLSYLDVIVLSLPLPRMLNYVARSTLFLPVLGSLIRSVGGFPIQREGMGASGLKETLRRLRDGGIVTLFPEGTRSRNGELGALKPGIAALVARAQVPVIPAGIAGTFEAWPRNQPFPRPHPIWVHYGPPILAEELAGVSPEAATMLIRTRILECQREARCRLTTLTADPSTPSLWPINGMPASPPSCSARAQNSPPSASSALSGQQ